MIGSFPPINCSADQCIVTVENPCSQNTMSRLRGFLQPTSLLVWMPESVHSFLFRLPPEAKIRVVCIQFEDTEVSSKLQNVSLKGEDSFLGEFKNTFFFLPSALKCFYCIYITYPFSAFILSLVQKKKCIKGHCLLCPMGRVTYF